MLALLKKLFHPAETRSTPSGDDEAEAISQTLLRLEVLLAENPADHDIQKQLMVKYNQAIKVYAANGHYRNRVDAVFEKMDELRNTIRRNL